jgi:hypothetical protein
LSEIWLDVGFGEKCIKVRKQEVGITFEWAGNLRLNFHSSEFFIFSKFGEICSIHVCFLSE